MKTLCAEISHETNTFSCRRTDITAFQDRYLLFDSDAVSARGSANTELSGFLRVAENYHWDMDHILSACAGPSGKVTDEAFEFLVTSVVDAASKKNYDGILLGLHGAMVTESYDDAEAELLRRIRVVVGSELPIAITLDLHANVSEAMCSLADILVSYKTYPHVDSRETATQAAEILQRTMIGEIKPRTIRVSRPMLEEVNGGRTDIGPMINRFLKARQYETEDDVFAVSINAGFASADIIDAGPTVLVTCQGNFNDHSEFAESIAEDIWSKRYEVSNTYLSVEEAAAIAVKFDSTNGSLIIADYADNPGAGGYGDSTNLLSALLDSGITNACFGPMVDPDLVRQMQSTQIGEKTVVVLGGKTNPQFGGEPLTLEVELLSLSNGDFIGDGPMMNQLRGSFGPTAVVMIAGIEILIVSLANQILDLQQFKTFGIDPESKKVVALKSMQHFRAAFAPIAAEIIICDSGALCTVDYARLPYQKVRRPIYPLDLFRDS